MGLAIDAAGRGERIAGTWSAEAIAISDRNAAKPQATASILILACVTLAHASRVHEALAADAPASERDGDIEKARAYFRKADEGWGKLPEAVRMRAGRFDLEAMSLAREGYARLAEKTL
jgi:hypothetical protein